MEKRFFTLQEARAMLPDLRQLMGKAMALTSRLEEHRAEAEKLAELASSNSGSEQGTVYVETLLRLQGALARVQEMGCLVKSVQDGLVDFPHLKEGREVYLCWKYGEEDIEYYHEVDAGFAGRTPLE